MLKIYVIEDIFTILSEDGIVYNLKKFCEKRIKL